MGARLACLGFLAAACGSEEAGPFVHMDFTRAGGLYAAPFPSDDLLVDGRPDVSAFPNPSAVSTIEQVRALLADGDGFALTGAALFQVSEAIDPAGLPDIATSATEDASVFVIGIDPGAPDHLVRYPLEVTFTQVPTKYSAPNVLALLPVQGIALRPHTRYAAVVTTALRSAAGRALDAADGDALARFPDAVAALREAGVEPEQIAGLTAFRTGDPAAQLGTVRAAALARPLPAIDAPFQAAEVFADYCVYQTTIALPDYQSGTPPYETSGGTWQFDAAGAPILQRMATANVVVTVPRTAAPAAGYPLMVFVRTGGGGDRPLVDRGQRDATGAAIVPGEGPARYLARAGFAGIQVDGPLGGRRNPNGADEQFLTFNVGNLGALRDNVRQSAVELAVIARVGASLQLDASACPGATAAARFDEGHIAIMGHSMGSWIAPLAAAHEPLFRALVLSGAGGSWIANIMYKVKPVHVLPVISAFVQEFDLRADDPVMTFAQWALEPADPQVYGAAIVREPRAGADPRHVLMAQGLVDNYILPRIANATSLAMGLDLAGPARDTADDPRLAGNLPLGPLLPLVGRAAVALPVSGNVRLPDGRVATAVVTQHAEDGIEDGHEVLFQTDVPKHQYTCFLASWLTGTPSVPPDGARDAPCP